MWTYGKVANWKTNKSTDQQIDEGQRGSLKGNTTYGYSEIKVWTFAIQPLHEKKPF